MSGIVMRFEREHRTAIDGKALSDDGFKADILLIPDGDPALSFNYGTMRLTVTGDSQKLPDVKASEMDQWLKDAIVAMLTSKTELIED